MLLSFIKVVDQAIDHVRRFSISRTEHGVVEQCFALINKHVVCDALAFTEVFEGIAGMQRVDCHINLASVAAGVQLLWMLLEGIGQGKLVHRCEKQGVGRLNVLQAKAPRDSVFQRALVEA